MKLTIISLRRQAHAGLTKPIAKMHSPGSNHASPAHRKTKLTTKADTTVISVTSSSKNGLNTMRAIMTESTAQELSANCTHRGTGLMRLPRKMSLSKLACSTTPGVPEPCRPE